MSRTRARRKPVRGGRGSSPREARVMEEIKNHRYLAFVRAIVGAKGSRSHS